MDKHNVETMSKRAFDALPSYQRSMPTGPKAGFKFKREFSDGWFMAELMNCDDPTCKNKKPCGFWAWSKIQIVDKK